MHKIEVLQWNFHRSNKALDSLKIDDKGRQVWLIQEPHTIENRVQLSCQGFKMYAKTAANRNRTCIMARQELKLLLNEELSNDDFTVCILEELNSSKVLVSGYLDIEKPPISEELMKIVEYANNNKLDLILALDSNAWSTVWGSHSSNDRGIQIEEFLANYDLYVMNEGNTATFENAISKTVIDVTITNRPETVINWEIEDELIYSDHRKICFDIIGEIKAEEKSTRNLTNVDWYRFKSMLNKIEYTVVETWSKETLNLAAEEWNKSVVSILDEIAPRKTIKISKKQVDWYNNELKKQKKTVYKAYKKAKHSGKEEDRQMFKTLRKDYFKSVQIAKQQSWGNFCKKVKTVSDMAKLNRIVNKNMNKSVGLLQTGTGLTHSTKESIDVLLKSHFEKSVKTQRDPDCIKEMYYNQLNIEWISLDKLKQAISEFSPYKNTVDDIKPIVLQNASKKALIRLKKIFEASISIGYTPRIWREQLVAFIPKPGKKDYSDPRAYRPITLASFVLKTLEKLCLWQIEKTLERLPISRSQHGFCKGRSTDSALTETLSKIESGVLNKGFSMAVFLDIKGAFDNVNPDLAIRILKQRLVDSRICDWYESFIKYRKVYTEINGVRDFRYVNTGLGQGLHTSALLWNLCFDEIIKKMDKDGVNCVAFADDVTLIGSGIDIGTIRSNIQRKVNQLVKWGKENDLKFNAAKTEVMIFTNKRKWQCDKIKVDGEDIEFSDSAKYLGVTIDRNLNWNEHIKNKVQSARQQLFMLRKVIGQNWSPNPKMLKWAYTAIVRPALSYGCHVWGNNLSKVQKDKLRKVNRLACLMIGKVQKSTPTAGLEIIYEIEPLHIFIERTAIATFVRINTQIRKFWSCESQITRKSHLKQLHSKAKKWGVIKESGNYGIDETNERRIEIKRYSIDEMVRKNWVEEDGKIYIYTDGSKTRNGVGYGFYIKGENYLYKKAVKMEDYNSVFQAEVIAIGHAAREASNKIHNKHIVVRSDSQSALQALKAASCNLKSVLQTVVSLNKLGLDNKISLEWVCSHEECTPDGNDIADLLAKEATENDIIENKFPPPKSYLTAKIRTASKKEWDNEWRIARDTKSNKEMYRQTRLFYPKSDNRLKDIDKYDRKRLGMIAAFITGHCNLRYHNHNKEPELYPDRTCRLCQGLGSVETVWHLVARCPSLMTLRVNIWKRYEIKEDENIRWEIKDLERFILHDKIQSLLKWNPIE